MSSYSISDPFSPAGVGIGVSFGGGGGPRSTGAARLDTAQSVGSGATAEVSRQQDPAIRLLYCQNNFGRGRSGARIESEEAERRQGQADVLWEGFRNAEADAGGSFEVFPRADIATPKAVQTAASLKSAGPPPSILADARVPGAGGSGAASRPAVTSAPRGTKQSRVGTVEAFLDACRDLDYWDDGAQTAGQAAEIFGGGRLGPRGSDPTAADAGLPRGSAVPLSPDKGDANAGVADQARDGAASELDDIFEERRVQRDLNLRKKGEWRERTARSSGSLLGDDGEVLGDSSVGVGDSSVPPNSLRAAMHAAYDREVRLLDRNWDRYLADENAGFQEKLGKLRARVEGLEKDCLALDRETDELELERRRSRRKAGSSESAVSRMLSSGAGGGLRAAESEENGENGEKEPSRELVERRLRARERANESAAAKIVLLEKLLHICGRGDLGTEGAVHGED